MRRAEPVTRSEIGSVFFPRCVVMGRAELVTRSETGSLPFPRCDRSQCDRSQCSSSAGDDRSDALDRASGKSNWNHFRMLRDTLHACWVFYRGGMVMRGIQHHRRRQAQFQDRRDSSHLSHRSYHSCQSPQGYKSQNHNQSRKHR